MIEDIGGVTSHLVKMALDVSMLRQQVIANNIANAKTSGFSPQRVRFEDYLEKNMMSAPNAGSDTRLASELQSLQSRITSGEVIVDSTEDEVKLDMEMARLADNVLRYQALLEGLSKRGSLIKMAITEGR